MNEDKWANEDWWVSPYNWEEEVRNSLNLSDTIQIHDATLRDGEQTPGVVFRKEDKVEIARRLAEIGVDRIEAGMPAVSREDEEAIKAICSLGLKSEIFTFARAMEGDVDKALECGAQGVIIEVPIGYPKLKYQFGWTWEDVFRKSSSVINYAKKKGLKVIYFPYDTTRARPEDLFPLLEAIKKDCPPDGVGIVDTMGCALPETIRFLVKKVKALTGFSVEVHTHNDFGMAVATELAGLAAGADVVHSCINGLGERTGNAALEELILGIHILLGRKTGYDLKGLQGLSEYVAEVSGVVPARNKPVVGNANYTRESGIGVDLVVKNPLAMFATNPAMTGRSGEVVLGKKSGKLSVQYKLEALGISGVSEEEQALILQDVKARGIEKRALLTDEEFLSIVHARNLRK